MRDVVRTLQFLDCLAGVGWIGGIEGEEDQLGTRAEGKRV
jgi:hypothetical protein